MASDSRVLGRTSAPSRTRVLYIAGTGRSGSTLLANILGEVGGVFNAGEVRYVWERGFVENRLCGCGSTFAECDVWDHILETAFPDTTPSAPEMVAAQRELTRVRSLPRLTRASSRRTLVETWPRYFEAIGRLYPAIAEATGAKVVVDSSKLPTYARLLSMLPSVELHVVHLVRDPRAAAFSWVQKKEQPDRGYAGYMERQGAVKSALLWDLWNTLTPVFARDAAGYVRVRYEDFVARPREVVGRLLREMELSSTADPFHDERSVELSVNHTVAGNPDRLKQGLTIIRPDVRWQKGLSAGDRRAVTLATLPLLVGSGYQPFVHPDRAEETSAIRVQDLSAGRRLSRRVRRHYEWARREGVMKLVEEDEVNPLERARQSLRKRRWRSAHGVRPGEATPVFIVGLQRSGTNMLARGIEASPEVEVHNENDKRAFERFRLRPDPVIHSIVATSRHRFVLFKPLIDSDRIGDILDGFPTSGRALWAYRGWEGRTRSAVAKFGDNNLRVLREIADGGGADLWQSRRLSRSSLDLIRSFDYGHLSPESGAALFWYVRNSLYFEQRLDERDDVMLVCYEQLLAEPPLEMRRIASFLGMDFSDELHQHISPRMSTLRRALQVDPRIQQHCESLEAALSSAIDRRHQPAV